MQILATPPKPARHSHAHSHMGEVQAATALLEPRAPVAYAHGIAACDSDALRQCLIDRGSTPVTAAPMRMLVDMAPCGSVAFETKITYHDIQ